MSETMTTETLQTSSRGIRRFFSARHFAFLPTLDGVFGAINGRSVDSTSADRLMVRAANDAAQR